MPRAATLDVLADLTEEQWGLFTTRQAETTGMAWSTLARLADQGVAERVAHGVYRLRGGPPDPQLALRAAWLQLAPDALPWDRTADQGVVSHRSAAALHGLGHLPADVHHFALPVRRQSRRHDVVLHRGHLDAGEWHRYRGLLVTRPARTAADLLAALEDPGAVGHLVADALAAGSETRAAVAKAIAPYAARFGLPKGDGAKLRDWLVQIATRG
jgi:predicted transcriptional regulator of viral defense system